MAVACRSISTPSERKVVTAKLRFYSGKYEKWSMHVSAIEGEGFYSSCFLDDGWYYCEDSKMMLHPGRGF